MKLNRTLLAQNFNLFNKDLIEVRCSNKVNNCFAEVYVCVCYILIKFHSDLRIFLNFKIFFYFHIVIGPRYFNQIDKGDVTEDCGRALGKYFWCARALMITQNW